MKTSSKKVRRAWAGIYEGRLDHGQDFRDNFMDGCYGIFNTKINARRKYELVIPCTITYTLPQRKKK